MQHLIWNISYGPNMVQMVWSIRYGPNGKRSWKCIIWYGSYDIGPYDMDHIMRDHKIWSISICQPKNTSASSQHQNRTVLVYQSLNNLISHKVHNRRDIIRIMLQVFVTLFHKLFPWKIFSQEWNYFFEQDFRVFAL